MFRLQRSMGCAVEHTFSRSASDRWQQIGYGHFCSRVERVRRYSAQLTGGVLMIWGAASIFVSLKIVVTLIFDATL